MEGNLIEEIYTGTLYDKCFTDCVIQNEADFRDKLIANIAKQVPQYINKGKGKPDINFVTNTDDPFLNEVCKPNFEKQDIIAVRGCKIDNVMLNGGNYIVKFGEPIKDQYYFAAVVKAPNSKPINIIFPEDKPFPIISQRAVLSKPMRFDEI